jgi:hypothetical protein
MAGAGLKKRGLIGMSILNIPVARNWQIKLPRVVRYIEEQFVDEFLSDGVLQLSSFRRCAKHEDKERCDQHEGWQTLGITSGDNMQKLTGITMPYPNVYMLCTSLILSESQRDIYGCNSGFIIKKPFEFSIAVGESLPACINCVQGSCFYQARRENLEHIDEPLVTDLPKSEIESDALAGKFEEYIRKADNLNSLFCKPLSFQHQQEYRFIWAISGIADDHIKVKSKKAAGLCEKIKLSS